MPCRLPVLTSARIPSQPLHEFSMPVTPTPQYVVAPSLLFSECTCCLQGLGKTVEVIALLLARPPAPHLMGTLRMLYERGAGAPGL